MDPWHRRPGNRFLKSDFSFYQDFCVKKLKFCCPGRDEFGKKCSKCPVDADGTVCSGNGICVGAGDKEGAGNCKCNDHFVGWKCHECHEDYYMSKGECHKCHKSCKVSDTIFRYLLILYDLNFTKSVMTFSRRMGTGDLEKSSRASSF